MRWMLLVVVFVFGGDLWGGGPVLLPWGDGAAQLGVYMDGSLYRGPRGLARVGSLWAIADGYKARVAFYDDSGRFQKALPLDGSSPRTTGFWITSDKSLVTFNDQAFTRWSADGKPVGTVSLGLSLPDGLGADNSLAFALFHDGDARFTLAWNRDFTQAHRWSLGGAGASEAAMQDAGGRFWLIDGGAQSQVYRWKAALPKGTRLVGWTASGASLWLNAAEDSFRLFWVSPQGDKVVPVTVPKQGLDTVWGVSPTLDFLMGETTDKGFLVTLQTAPISP